MTPPSQGLELRLAASPPPTNRLILPALDKWWGSGGTKLKDQLQEMRDGIQALPL